MKILILCEYFAPDSIIGAKRTTKFAKYLSAMKHDVYVIWSGTITQKIDIDNMNGLENVKIYSYNNGEDIGDKTQVCAEQKESKYKNTKNKFIRWLKKAAHIFYDPYWVYYKHGIVMKNQIIDLYNSNEEIRGFDFVLSTFSTLGSLQAGQYIKACEKCKWVVDFRDLMTNTAYTPIVRFINYFTQKKYVCKADACLCVSLGNTEMLKKMYPQYKEKVHTVFNGFDQETYVCSESATEKKDKLKICYTGALYNGMRDISPLFSAILNVKKQKEFDVRVMYAGADSEFVKEQAKKYDLEDIVEDFGLLSRKEAIKLQQSADLFLVITWNTKKEQGILTGKFYESLVAKKPIIALVAGNEPNSELKKMIETYSLGVCYEQATYKDSKRDLEEFLYSQYKNKKKYGEVFYEPDDKVMEEFCYEGIVKKLVSILEKC